MSEFKVGDKVKCVNVGERHKKLQLGKEYIVLKVGESLLKPYREILHIVIDKEEYTYYSNRFELVEED